MEGIQAERKRNQYLQVRVERDLKKSRRSQCTGRLLHTFNVREGYSRKSVRIPSKGKKSSFDTSAMHGETKTLLKKVNV